MILFLYLLLLLNVSNSIVIQVSKYTLIQNEDPIEHYKNDFKTITGWSEAAEVIKTGEFNFVNITYTPDDSNEIESVVDFPSIEYFWLEKTNQNSIPELKNLPKLSILNLSKNNISVVKSNVISTVPVVKIYLNNNKIKEIEDQSFGSNLTKLSLNFNSIRSVSSKWFKNPEKLVFLYLVGNEIESVRRDDFKDFIDIEKILLGFNRIKRIESGSFGFSRYFYKLTFDYNQLVELNEDIFGDVVKIDKFYFSYNRVSYLSDEFLKKVEIGEEFWVYGNPWLCSCVEKINQTVGARVTDWGNKYDVTDDVKICENSKDHGTCQPIDDQTALQKVKIGDQPIDKDTISYFSYNIRYYPCTKMNSCAL